MLDTAARGWNYHASEMRETSVRLHLVGETIDAKQAHLRAQAGQLVQLIRGVYVDAGTDADTVVLGHAVRIAHYLYPAAYLSAASAVLLGPSPDGRLFISGRRNQRTRLRTLEIVQNEAPARPSIGAAIVGDDLGELHIDVSSPRQRFLEAFRLRSEHASSITEPMRAQMTARLIEEFGTPEGAADALWALARELGWYREGEAAERRLLASPQERKTPVNKAALKLIVAWHGDAIGRLVHDGFEWRWTPARKSGPPVIRETTPGKLPPFIESLLPEGWLAEVLREKDEREALRAGKRYISNMTIATTRREIQSLPADILEAELQAFTSGGEFTGRYEGPSRGEIEESFERKLAALFARAETPRLSGVQIKAPMCLDRQGRLLPAVDRPFTHILKPAGAAGFEMLPVVEWLCLELGRSAGMPAPAAALIDMPDGMPSALLVERFDIRRGDDDGRKLAMEDFCSVLGLPPSAKYDGTIERAARGLRGLSTDPAADVEALFRRALFAWLIADGDMHLKNLALLKIAQGDSKTFDSVRLAPLYDPVTTRVFPRLAHDRMALKLSGKDDGLTRKDFLALAKTSDMGAAVANRAIDGMAAALADAVAGIELPVFARRLPAAEAKEAAVKAVVAERTVAFQ